MTIPLFPVEIKAQGPQWGQHVIRAFDLPQSVPGLNVDTILSKNFALSSFLGVDSVIPLNIRHESPQKGEDISIIDGPNGRSVTLTRTPDLGSNIVKLSEVINMGPGRKEMRTVEIRMTNGLATTIRDYRAVDTINVGSGQGFVDTGGYVFETALIDGSLKQSVMRQIKRDEVKESGLAEDIVLRSWERLPQPIELPTGGEKSMLPDFSLVELPLARFSGFDK